MKAHITKIGNSEGVVIPPVFLSHFGLDKDADVDIELLEEGIIIKPVKVSRADWEQQLQAEIAQNEEPKEDYFSGISNEFDETEWNSEPPLTNKATQEIDKFLTTWSGKFVEVSDDKDEKYNRLMEKHQ